MPNEIEQLIGMDPLPDDAEDRLQNLLDAMEDREVAEAIAPMCFEAIATKRLADTDGSL